MLNKLKNLFSAETDTNSENNDTLELMCGLMIEAANSDGVIENKEIEKIKNTLVNKFNETIENVDHYLRKAIENKNNSNSLFHYTSKINKEFSEQQKLLLIETLWEIVLSDGDLHDYESSLIRRISGLLYVSDVSSGNAKKRALNNVLGKT